MQNILIVDDDKDIRKVFKKIFKESGFGIFEAADALQASEEIMKHKAQINVVLLDIQIPEIDGRDIYDIISEYAPQIPIVVWSVLPINDQKLRIPRARDYCQKSSNKNEIVKKLKAILS